jgi:sulfide:quinone oxidoreductase
VLAEFQGGRVIVGVTSTPFKCPPAPSETVLLMHDLLVRRGVRDRSEISLVMPLGAPVPPSPAASQALLAAFDERGIGWFPDALVRRLDPDRQVVSLADGRDLPYDLFLGVPAHHPPAVVEASGLCVDGWVPVDPLTLETQFDGVYAVGDVTSVGTPKAGVFAEGQASVVAAAILASRAGVGEAVHYDGRGQCYLEFGDERVATVDVTFAPDAAPRGSFEGPSRELADQKRNFGSSRIERWFGRTWPSS